jgi:hypothetical protein
VNSAKRTNLLQNIKTVWIWCEFRFFG